MELQISVIIPVYNAAPFVRKAVESALSQPETAEVLLIEDGSPDNSLEVCRELDAEYEKVRLFTHDGNANLGAGPTRNVGIENARYDYIAFLDADDYYLPDRFRAERKIFKENPDADGVYGAAGFHCYSDEARDFYFREGYREMVTFRKELLPEDLFESQIGFSRSFGTIHLDTLTVSSNIFKNGKVSGFPSLRIGQDVDFLFRLSYQCRLYFGVLKEPVCMIGVHDRNRMVRVPKDSTDKVDLLKNLRNWAINEGLQTKYVSFFSNRMRLVEIQNRNRIGATAGFLSAIFRTDSILSHKFLTSAAINHILGDGLTRILKKPLIWFWQEQL